MPLHETDREPNRIALQAFNTAVLLGLSDAKLTGVVTVTGLQTAITALATHEDQVYAKVRINKAIKVAKDLGTLADGALLDTAAEIRQSFKTADPTIAPVDQQGGILFGE